MIPPNANFTKAAPISSAIVNAGDIPIPTKNALHPFNAMAPKKQIKNTNSTCFNGVAF